MFQRLLIPKYFNTLIYKYILLTYIGFLSFFRIKTFDKSTCQIKYNVTGRSPFSTSNVVYLLICATRKNNMRTDEWIKNTQLDTKISIVTCFSCQLKGLYRWLRIYPLDR